MKTNSIEIDAITGAGPEISIDEFRLLNQLPKEIGNSLLTGFLNGKSLGLSERKSIANYFRNHSFISRVLMKDPGTFEMLEVIYTGENVHGAIDNYLFNAVSSKALQNRLSSVIVKTGEIVQKKLADKENLNLKILNLGSGTGRDTIGVLSKGTFDNSVFVECVDIDYMALEKAKVLARENAVEKNFKFVEGSLTKLSYRNEIDIGLMIGILCGLPSRVCMIVLRKMKKYFKKGAKLIVSNVLQTMQEQDPFMAYLLDVIIGWKLVYKTPKQLQEIVKEAGYQWEGIFYDEPTRFHGMAICSVPLS